MGKGKKSEDAELAPETRAAVVPVRDDRLDRYQAALEAMEMSRDSIEAELQTFRTGLQKDYQKDDALRVAEACAAVGISAAIFPDIVRSFSNPTATTRVHIYIKADAAPEDIEHLRTAIGIAMYNFNFDQQSGERVEILRFDSSAGYIDFMYEMVPTSQKLKTPFELDRSLPIDVLEYVLALKKMNMSEEGVQVEIENYDGLGTKERGRALIMAQACGELGVLPGGFRRLLASTDNLNEGRSGVTVEVYAQEQIRIDRGMALMRTALETITASFNENNRSTSLRIDGISITPGSGTLPATLEIRYNNRRLEEKPNAIPR